MLDYITKTVPFFMSNKDTLKDTQVPIYVIIDPFSHYRHPLPHDLLYLLTFFITNKGLVWSPQSESLYNKSKRNTPSVREHFTYS